MGAGITITKCGVDAILIRFSYGGVAARDDTVYDDWGRNADWLMDSHTPDVYNAHVSQDAHKLLWNATCTAAHDEW